MPQLTINKRVEKFRSLAENLQSKIDYYLKPAITYQRPTARRAKITASMQSEGLRLEQLQGWLLGMSGAIEKGILPPVLENISSRSQLEFLQEIDENRIDEIYNLDNSHFHETRQKLIALKLTAPDDAKEALAFLKEIRATPSLAPTCLKIQELERALIGVQIPGFFPTPEAIAQQIVKEAGIKQGTRTLEPSAGIGNIALAAREAGALVDCVELRPQLVEILQLKELSVRRGNFLEMTPDASYQAVILNPPFENGQDAAHIRQAYDWLVAGGKLVAIASNAVTFNEKDVYKRFRAWLDEVGGTIEPLPDHAFLTAFRPTTVKTVMIVVVK